VKKKHLLPLTFFGEEEEDLREKRGGRAKREGFLKRDLLAVRGTGHKAKYALWGGLGGAAGLLDAGLQ